MYYVTDTHPMFWAMFSPDRLSSIAQTIFDKVGEGQHTIYVPAIVVTELMMIVERRCTSVKYAEVHEMLRVLQRAGNYLFLPLMPETVMSSYSFSDQITDIFDRLIITEARRLRVPLITCDQGITSTGLVDVAWD
jgi:PIN domain nuclease of toxin-antitoxin system